ncbi:DUF3574 domain-containing protein [Roseomonas sp. AR75]|uniref:DUF3574 domain-containing protein n=1 Tax=Roseomonas sp. AR75 TaxID=2562311 RepID=UPI0010C08F5F|nr:DUF3574 domain-containing protein [Roseomonas sp. AR75]
MTRLLLALPLLGGCAQIAAAPMACPAGLEPAAIAEAAFGRNAGGREIVSDNAWQGFLDDVVTPSFPDGLTVLDAAGQWRGRDGRIARERSKLLLLVLPGGSVADATSAAGAGDRGLSRALRAGERDADDAGGLRDVLSPRCEQRFVLSPHRGERVG